ncbi:MULTISPECIES: hypothetical protein [unclassified Pseudovibrio]|uniref:hypothetical protein n=1 Tax=unclassified Pseudovibrio TaxID=2627060 RepID=UPI0007AEA506|nr:MULTISPECIES: hypothetical protein [unclassified Pseudovibrio]KZL03358.1 hypothetical protein PsW74_00784 [Pseudovibrio sp. W74]KZL12188.1 hypothetical protein PsAD14_00355 [Pseudovibrio sp. Ad14]
MSFYLQKLFALHLTPDDDKENSASALATVQTFAVMFGTALAGRIANSAFWLFSSFAVFGILGIFSTCKITNWHASTDLKEVETHF